MSIWNLGFKPTKWDIVTFTKVVQQTISFVRVVTGTKDLIVKYPPVIVKLAEWLLLLKQAGEDKAMGVKGGGVVSLQQTITLNNHYNNYSALRDNIVGRSRKRLVQHFTLQGLCYKVTRLFFLTSLVSLGKWHVRRWLKCEQN